MPNSQIDMVVRDGNGWRVCGDFETQAGRPDRDVDLYVVVRQGDVVARGHQVVPIREEWQFEVVAEGATSKSGSPRSRQRWPSPGSQRLREELAVSWRNSLSFTGKTVCQSARSTVHVHERRV